MTPTKAIQCALSISFLALLGACTAQTETTLPDGSVAYRIDCDRTTRGLNYCFEKAGRSCGAAGYSIVDRDGQLVSSSRVAESDMDTLVREYEADQNSILIQCGS